MAIDQAPARAADTATIARASALYVNFGNGLTLRNGVAASLTGATYGTGMIRSAGTNLLGSVLPFAGANVTENKLPTGLTWQGTSSPKVLKSVSAEGLVFTGSTTTASPSSFGGIRTSIDVAQPGQTVLLSLRSNIGGLTGDPNASIVAFLFRESDQTSTMAVRVHNVQEPVNGVSIIRMKAPNTGTEGFQLVLSTQAGKPGPGQSASIGLAQLLVLNEPAAAPTIGSRYATPSYFAKTSAASNLLLAPRAAAGIYFLIVRTAEFGWGAETVSLSDAQSTIDIKSVFGVAVNMTIREVYVIAQSAWQPGWMDILSPTPDWTNVRYMNIDGSVGSSRPLSPAALSRMSGMPAGLSALASDLNRNLPTLGAPDVANAVAFNALRLSHQAFEADTTHYVADSPTSIGIHSELWPANSVAFDRDEWISFWTRTATPILDAPGNGEVTIFQYRYVNNVSGDSSALAPELSLAQLTGDRFALRIRTDRGLPVLSGSSTPAGIYSVEVPPVAYRPGQWNAIVVRVRFSNTGGGYVAFWCNGVKLFDQAVGVGYNRNIGPRLHYGVYKYSAYANRTEFQHMENGARSLASRVASPLPI
ncbi:heparin lyase I family protein [Lacisediminihabitans sp.]|uniref:heparin lyase I family protein n=1 Tax=Lacisediminihabitans sp. TaxID=2787631 RepID=UPI00374D22ED